MNRSPYTIIHDDNWTLEEMLSLRSSGAAFQRQKAAPLEHV